MLRVPTAFEIRKGDGGGEIVAGLSCGVHDGVRLDLLEEIEYSLAVADVELMVNETLDLAFKTVLVPTGIAFGTEENSPLVVIDTVNFPTFSREIKANLGADQTRGSCDQNLLHPLLLRSVLNNFGVIPTESAVNERVIAVIKNLAREVL
jgi:hypothetical protein